MRFTIKREELLKALNIVSRAIGSKVAIAVLANFKLDLDEKGLFIVGSNREITIKTFIPYRQGENDIIRNYKEGSTLLNAKILCEIIRKMNSDETTIDVIDSTIATISDNVSEYRLNCIRASDYPPIDLEPEGTRLELSRQEFENLVSQTAFAASIKEQRPILTAINLEAGNGQLTVTTTDSARMARKQLAIPQDIYFVSNVPAKMMVEVSHIIEGCDSLEIAFSEKKALFSFGNTVVATRLVAGDYPNTKNIVPKITNYYLEVNAAALVDAIGRANVLSLDRENVVDMTMSENGVEISAKSSQMGSAVSKIDLFKYEGNQLKVSFNSEFVVSAIKALNCVDVTFLFVGEMKPFVIKNASDDSVIQIVTPVRTY